jgi:site-specific recombinase XerD
LEAVLQAHIRAYLMGLQERQLTDHSIQAAARSLRASFNFTLSEELLEISPMAKVRMPKLEKMSCQPSLKMRLSAS